MVLSSSTDLHGDIYSYPCPVKTCQKKTHILKNFDSLKLRQNHTFFEIFLQKNKNNNKKNKNVYSNKYCLLPLKQILVNTFLVERIEKPKMLP